MAKFSPYEIYQMHTALKSHFTSNFDFTKSSGKVRSSRAAFARRSDVYFFEKASFEHRDPIRLIVATAAEQLPIHTFPTIVECLAPTGTNALIKWDRITQSLKYEIEQWLTSVSPSIDDFNDIYSWNMKDAPLIFNAPRPIAAALVPAAPEEFEQRAHLLAKPYIKLYRDLRPFLKISGYEIESAVIKAIGPKYNAQQTALDSNIGAHINL